MRKKKEIWSRVKLINKCITKGKVKLSKKTTVNLSKTIDNAVSGSIVGLLDGIISREDVVIENENKTDILCLASGPMYITDKSSFDTEFTIVIPVAKKNAVDIFNYLDDSTVGDLLTSSTLGQVYKRVKTNWINCNDPSSPLTSTMYIPHVCIILDPYTGQLKKYYRMVNVLFVGVPSKKVIESTNGGVILRDEEYSSRIIADIMDSAIKCGCKNLIINPYAYKLHNNLEMSSNLWQSIVTSNKVNEHINSITFSVTNDAEFIVMTNRLFKEYTE